MEVKNYGEAEVPTTSFGIYIYIDEDASDGRTWTYSVSTLADQDCIEPGGVCTLTPQYVDVDASHVISVDIDPYYAVEESDENNNQDTLWYYSENEEDEEEEEEVYLPDLVSDAWMDDDGEFTVKVTNEGKGNVDTDSWHVYITVDDKTWTYSVSTLADQGCLDAGNTCHISPAYLSTDEEHKVYVQVDPNNVIEEYDEDNNDFEGIIIPSAYGDNDDHGSADECEGWWSDYGCTDFGEWNWLNGEYCAVYNEDWSDMECEDVNDSTYSGDSVCGNDGITYESEEAAIEAGTNMSYWGECGIADRRELYEMQRSLDNDRVDFDDVISRSEHTLEGLDKYIELFEKYYDEASEHNFDELSELKTVVSERTSVFESYKSEVEAVQDEAESYTDGYQDFIDEAQARYDLVETGDRGSQYFWSWWQKHDFYWKLRETIERKIDPYDDRGIYDLIGREPIKIAYEAAQQGVLSDLDWTPFEEVEDGVAEVEAAWEDIENQLDALQAAVVEIIEDTDDLSWEEIDDIRWDLDEQMQWIYLDMDYYWMTKDMFWDSEPWQHIDSMWKSINWARESEFAISELKEMIARWEEGDALDIAKDIFVQPYAQDAITALIEVRDEKLDPAARYALEKAEELQNPDPIWYFFEEVLEPTEYWAMPKLEYLADLYFSEYEHQVGDDDREVLDEFFGKFIGFHYDLSGGFDDVIDLEENELDHFIGLVGEDVLNDVIEQVVAHVSAEVIKALVGYDQDMGIGLDHLMTLSAHAGDADKLAQHAANVQVMAETLGDLQAAGGSNTALDGVVKEALDYASVLYGPDANDLRNLLAAIDPTNVSDEEVTAIEDKLAEAIVSSPEAKYEDDLLAFTDTWENQWYYTHVAGAKNNDWVGGYGDGTFGPGNSVTQAEILKMVFESLEYGPASGTPSLSAAHGHWAEGYYKQAENLGLDLSGFDSPNDPAMRIDIASLIVQLLDLPAGDSPSFTDVDSSDMWVVGAINSAEIMTGDDGVNRFRPYDGINRAEAATVIGRAYDTMLGNAAAELDLTEYMDDVDQFEAVDLDVFTSDDWAEDNMLQKLGASLLNIMDFLKPSVLMIGM